MWDPKIRPNAGSFHSSRADRLYEGDPDALRMRGGEAARLLEDAEQLLRGDLSHDARKRILIRAAGAIEECVRRQLRLDDLRIELHRDLSKPDGVRIEIRSGRQRQIEEVPLVPPPVLTASPFAFYYDVGEDPNADGVSMDGFDMEVSSGLGGGDGERDRRDRGSEGSDTDAEEDTNSE